MARRRALIVAAVLAALAACDELPPEGDQPRIAGHRTTPDPCANDAGPDWCHPTAPDGGLACRYGIADGVCESSGVVEGCDCDDCLTVARCLGTCADDGFCAAADGGAGEDCSCADCNEKVPACARPSVGCVKDGLCDFRTDDCTCADCAADATCAACVDNGVCVPINEGCVCDDCAGTEACKPAG